MIFFLNYEKYKKNNWKKYNSFFKYNNDEDLNIKIEYVIIFLCEKKDIVII